MIELGTLHHCSTATAVSINEVNMLEHWNTAEMSLTTKKDVSVTHWHLTTNIK